MVNLEVGRDDLLPQDPGGVLEPLVCGQDGGRAEVVPDDVRLEHGDGEGHLDLGQAELDRRARAVPVGVLDRALVGVCPVDAAED